MLQRSGRSLIVSSLTAELVDENWVDWLARAREDRLPISRRTIKITIHIVVEFTQRGNG